jgi:hypothetical protein
MAVSDDKIETLAKMDEAKEIHPSVSENGNRNAEIIPTKLTDHIHREGLAISDCGVVSWTDRSVLHPSRWPLGQKFFDTSVILFFEFFT